MTQRHPALHDDPTCAQVLAVVNAHSRPAVAGMPRRLFNYRFRLMAGEREPAGAIAQLCNQGWLAQTEDGDTLWLTPEGYRAILERFKNAEEFTGEAGAPGAPRNEGPPSEYALRTRVLDIFREAGVGKRGHIAAEDLNRFWSVSGRRADELRHGLDILMRDGYVRIGRFRKTLFRLQSEGARYLKGRPAPEALESLAQPAVSDERHFKTLPDESLLVLAVHVFKQRRALPPRSLSFGELEYGLDDYELPAFAQFHAAELLHRFGYVDLHDDGALQITLTDEGRGLLRTADSEMVQWVTRMALDDMSKANADGGSGESA